MLILFSGLRYRTGRNSYITNKQTICFGKSKSTFTLTVHSRDTTTTCINVKRQALSFCNSSFPNIKDPKAQDGMTILHLAAADKQIEVIKFLTTRSTINVNALNANGFTALDILAQSKRDIKDWEIAESLRHAGAISGKDNILLSTHDHGAMQTNSLTSHENNKKQQGKGLENCQKKADNWLEKMREALMVVASLIATMAFQAATNPPRKAGQDTRQNPTVSKAAGANPPQISRHRVPPSSNGDSYPVVTNPFAISINKDYDYHRSQDSIFFIFNTIGFMASLSIILLLISGLPLRRRLFTWILMITIWVAIIAMALAYLVTRDFFEDTSHFVTYPVILLWIISLGAILLLGHTIRIIVKMIKYTRKLISRLRQNKAQDAPEPPIALIV